MDPNGPCQQYTEANDVLRDLKSNLREDKQLLMQVLASVWRKVMPPPSTLHAIHAACLAGCDAAGFARCQADVIYAVSDLCQALGDASISCLLRLHR